MKTPIQLEQEDDGRWVAEVALLPGVLAYGATREEAGAKAAALAERVLTDRREHNEPAPNLGEFTLASLVTTAPGKENWRTIKARALLAGILRSTWVIKRDYSGSHRILERPNWPEVIFPFQDHENIGPAALARHARRTGVNPHDIGLV